MNFHIKKINDTNSYFLVILLIFAFSYFLVLLKYPLFFTRTDLNNYLEHVSFILVAFLTPLYVLFIYFLNQLEFTKPLNKIVLLFTSLIIIFGIFSYPINSQDQNWSMVMSRGFLIEHKNPYIVQAGNMGKTSWVNSIVAWRFVPMPYGPLSLYIYAIPSLITNNFYVGLFIIKILSLASFFGCLSLIRKITYSLQKTFENKHFYYIFFNPVVFFNVFLSVHIDIFVAFFIVLFVYFLVKRNYLLSLLSLSAGILLKYFPVLLGGIFIYKLFSDKLLSIQKKLLIAFTGGILALFLALLLYYPFIHNCYNYKCLLTGFNFQTRLATFSSKTYIVYLLNIFGIRGFSQLLLSSILAVFLSIYFISKNKIIEAVFWSLLLFIITGLNWVMPWYFLMIVFFVLPWISLSYFIYISLFFLLISIGLEAFFSSIFVTLLALNVYLLRKYTPLGSIIHLSKKDGGC